MVSARLTSGSSLVLAGVLFLAVSFPVRAQQFEEAVVDVGNVGLTVTNAGFVGKSNVRNNPAGPPSFEYPLDSGVEHLFEAGLWVGARRADGIITVRTGAVTSSSGYQAGASGYEFAQSSFIQERSSLVTSDAYSPNAVSHQDYLTAFQDTMRFVPGTLTPMPDVQGRLGIDVRQRSYAWSFPFTEYFVVVEYEITNVSNEPWRDIHVGLWHDLVVRNVNTTTDTGTSFFNKGGKGFIGYPRYEAGTGRVLNAAPDSMFANYAFNAGGTEQTLNTYGSIAFLGAYWPDPNTGQQRFFHPFVADEYERDGLAIPRVNPRWWKFSGADPELGRPQTDEERYRRMSTPYPNPAVYDNQAAYEAAVANFFTRLRTEGVISDGNWIGLTPVGPFERLDPGQTITVTFAFVAALKPEQFQGQAGKPIDTEESRSILRTNINWAQQTYAGEDQNYNGVLDPGEDLNNNGVLDRYLIPEPPRSPRVRAVPGNGRVTLYWDRGAESSVDPVTGLMDFEGYRVYRSNPGDDRTGNIFGRTTMVAQYDRPGNATGFNTGFGEVALESPVTFPNDTTQYWYRYEADGLLNGWQYAFSVTAFDEGDVDSGLPSFESSRAASSVRAFPGTPAAESAADGAVGVYPNPYRAMAAWDGESARSRKLYFTNLPARAEIRVYTVSGEVVAEMQHDSATYVGDTRWFNEFSGSGRVMSGGEHAWDILSDNNLRLATGLYLFSVRNLDTGETQTGKFVIIK